MKKILSFIGAIAATAICFSACQKETAKPEESGQTHTVVFTAETPKTVLGDGIAEWLESDKGYFHVFEDGSKATSTIVEITDQGKAVVTATFSGSAAGSHDYTGFVASSLSNSGNPKVLTEQTTTSQVESYDPAADILFAKPVTGENLTNVMFQYKRVVAINKMNLVGVLDGETVSKVTIAGNKSIAGSFNKGTGAYTPNDKTIVVNTDATTVYFISGKAEDVTLTVTVNTDKAIYTKTFAKTIDLVEGSLHEFTVTYGAEHRKEISTEVYRLVTSVADLEAGDLIKIGCSSKEAAAGALYSTKKYFTKVSATFSDDGTTMDSVEAAIIVLGGDATKGWSLWVDGNQVGYSGTDLALNSSLWTISIDNNGVATIAESTATSNTIQYNSGSPRFKPYSSSQSAIQIYKLDDGKTPLGAPEITLDVNKEQMSVTVSWKAVEHATSYTVKCTGKEDVVTSGTSTVFTGLEKDVDYTVTVIAEGGASYRPGSASKTFKIQDQIDSIDKIYAAATKAGNTETDITITFGNWVISGVSSNKKNAYLTDGTKGLIIYDNNGTHGFVKGDKLSGTASCKIKLYNGAAEIVSLTSSTEGLKVEKGGSVSPCSVSIAELSGINTGAYVSITGVIYNGYVFSDGTNTITPYGTIITLPELKKDTKYNIKGVYVQYGDTKEIAPLAESDFEEIAAPKYKINIATGIQHGSVSTDPANEAIEGVEVTLSSTPDKGYALKSVSVKKTASGTSVTVENNKFTMPGEAVTVSAEFEESQGGDPVTVKFIYADLYSSVSSSCDVTSDTVEGVTIVYAKVSGSNAPKYYNNGKNLRIYDKSTMTFTAPEGKKITKIAAVGTTTWVSGKMAADTGTVSDANKAWTGSSNTVVLTVTGSFKFEELDVTFE